MRRAFALTSALLVLALSGIGCGKKADQASESTTDSLMTSNPVEQPQGQITPQTEYQPPPAQQTPPPAPPKKTTKPSSPPVAVNPGVKVPAGTQIKLTVDAGISSETAHQGDTWTGVVKEPVVIGTSAPIPAGSVVHGVVSGAREAEKGSRAMLVLHLTSVEVNGTTHHLSASTDSIIAGSTRARNLGAIAGGAAAGALVGKMVGGSNKGALIGGIIGGAATTGAVAASKGYQVVLKPGTELAFTVDEPVVMK